MVTRSLIDGWKALKPGVQRAILIAVGAALLLSLVVCRGRAASIEPTTWQKTYEKAQAGRLPSRAERGR